MKKIILAAFICVQFVAGRAFAQSGDLEVVGADPEALNLGIGQTTNLLITINQNGPQDLPAGSARVGISITPSQLNWVFPIVITDDCGGVWTVQGSPTATTAQLNIRNNNAPLVNGAACTIKIPVVAVTAGLTKFNVTSSVLGGGASDPNGTNQGGGGEISLPVKLSKFNAIRENEHAVLNWETTLEINSEKFDIERKVKSGSWTNIGSVEAKNTNSMLQTYQFVDARPVDGENMYRLKMIDLDASFAYSMVKSVSIKKAEADFYVYPNPSAELVKLRDPENVASVSIIDLNGKTVYQTTAVTKGEISVKNLSIGMYTVQIKTKDGVSQAQKLVVAR